jgi:hypothetical protein
MGRFNRNVEATWMARLVLLLILLLAGTADSAAAATAIGKVTRLQGDAQGTVDGITKIKAVDDAVYLGEAVATGADARLELTFDDRTVLTLGERATLRLDAFVYRPETNIVKVTLAGAFRYVSGARTPAAARDETVSTPFSVIAVRGTDFWGGPIDGVFGVALFEGAVSVTNAGLTAELTAPGQGVNFDTPASPPGPVTLWALDRVARAVDTVTFR